MGYNRYRLPESDVKAVVEFGDLVVQVIALFLINSGFASINKGQFFLFVNPFFKKSFAFLQEKNQVHF